MYIVNQNKYLGNETYILYNSSPYMIEIKTTSKIKCLNLDKDYYLQFCNYII